MIGCAVRCRGLRAHVLIFAKKYKSSIEQMLKNYILGGLKNGRRENGTGRERS